MVDLTEHERAAILAAKTAVAAVMAEFGWFTPLNALTEAQVLTLVEVAVDGFQDAMRACAAPGEPGPPF